MKGIDKKSGKKEHLTLGFFASNKVVTMNICSFGLANLLHQKMIPI